MSKRGYISRYLLVLKRLKSKPYSSYEELLAYLGTQLEHLQLRDDSLSVSFSKRTLQRDLREIRNLFGIDIIHDKGRKGYYISQSETEQMNFQRMLEAFDMFNSLNLSRDMTPFVHLEKRRPQGTENLYGLMHAIKLRLEIDFNYQKFWDEKETQRLVQPYALKEFRNRWYLLANDLKDEQIKSFALDRLSNLTLTKTRFKLPDGYDPESIYKYSFGIISPNSDKPEHIILAFTPFQGKYIKTLPLHETQVIEVDNNKVLQVRLTLFITHDFIMELLSFGENVKVLAPGLLAQTIYNEHKRASRLYK